MLLNQVEYNLKQFLGMIQGLSEQTKPLTDYEDKVILPLIVQGLHGKVGKYKAITNKAMCSALKSYGCKIDSPRIRKIINHIRLRVW